MVNWHNLGRLSFVVLFAVACSSGESSESNVDSSTGGADTTDATTGGAESSSFGGNPQTDTKIPSDGGVIGSGGSTVAAGGAGGSSCTTLPPVWSDCATAGDFQPVVTAAGAGGTAAAPESLAALQDLSSMSALVREQTKASVLSQYTSYWKSLRSTNCSQRISCPSHGVGGASAAAGGYTSTTGSTTTTTRSGTNNQVVGVDEPDLLKLDSRYVYIVTPTDLLILDAQNPATTISASRLPLEGTPKSLLVSGDRALVIASTGVVSQKANCTYAYTCQFAGDGYGTLLLVLDLSDRTKPRLMRRVQLSGSYLAGRMIGSVAHIVTSDVFKAPLISWSYPNITTATAAEGLASLDSQYQTAIAAVSAAPVNFTLPTTTDKNIPSDGSAATTNTIAPNQMHGSIGIPGGTLTVTSLDFSTATALYQDLILSNPGALYASQDRLYMAIPEEKSNYAGYGMDATWIHGFTLSGAKATYQGSGRVKGHVLNQFSLDEYQGNLRVATSTGWVPDPLVHSTVSILGWQGNRLVRTGAVDDIAPTEDIRAVRFVGPRGYVVTFKKTDPLFVLDLADPVAPKMQGELKIPGFSTYIHPLDEQHLLSMGYDADDQGSFAFFNGVQLQIMNVADPINPSLLFKETIGTRGSSSEALTDHLAFNYFAAKKMLAIPMTICEGGGNGTFGDVLTFTGLLVYDVTVEAGFKLHGRVPHPAPSGYFGGTSLPKCSNWWTNASSPVKRSAFIEDYVLSLGDALVKIDPLASLGNSVATFPVGSVPCQVLSESECKLNNRCLPIRGTVLGGSAEEYLGCASVPTSQTTLTCQAGATCITNFSSKACATVASSCVPDGWGALVAGTCTATACGS